MLLKQYQFHLQYFIQSFVYISYSYKCMYVEMLNFLFIKFLVFKRNIHNKLILYWLIIFLLKKNHFVHKCFGYTVLFFHLTEKNKTKNCFWIWIRKAHRVCVCIENNTKIICSPKKKKNKKYKLTLCQVCLWFWFCSAHVLLFSWFILTENFWKSILLDDR